LLLGFAGTAKGIPEDRDDSVPDVPDATAAEIGFGRTDRAKALLALEISVIELLPRQLLPLLA
jgi:hypothetical protein